MVDKGDMVWLSGGNREGVLGRCLEGNTLMGCFGKCTLREEVF